MLLTVLRQFTRSLQRL